MLGLNVCRSDGEVLVRRPPFMGAEAGSLSTSAANPFATDCGLRGGEEEADEDGLVGMFLRISSYKSRRKSSLKRPKVAQAVAKVVKFG